MLINSIRDLQETCERYEQIQLKLNWDMLEIMKGVECYSYFEDNQLVGFIGAYSFGNKIELCGMVHPKYRRRDIFTNLVNEAIAKVPSNQKILLNAPAASESGKLFLETIDCHFGFSECVMKWENMFVSNQNVQVSLREAVEDDAKTIIRLDVACFQNTEAEAKAFYETLPLYKNDFYMIEVDGKTVGKIRVIHEKKESWIYSFAIFPEYQGKGYGKSTLQQIIKKEKKLGQSVLLEVALTNLQAKKLYEEVGFVMKEQQHYYLYHS